jgi:hypothetical protein
MGGKTNGSVARKETLRQSRVFDLLPHRAIGRPKRTCRIRQAPQVLKVSAIGKSSEES